MWLTSDILPEIRDNPGLLRMSDIAEHIYSRILAVGAEVSS